MLQFCAQFAQAAAIQPEQAAYPVKCQRRWKVGIAHKEGTVDSLSNAHERERLFVLQSTRLLDSGPQEGFDRITRITSALFRVPVVLLSLIDSDRQWFLSSVGVDIQQTCREDAFCDYTIRGDEVLVVEDARLDPRFARNPLVTGPTQVRFYAGAPLITTSGHALGTLCLIDHEPRTFDRAARAQLQDLAEMVMAKVELLRSVGRIDAATQLPNRVQLSEDLHDLCGMCPGQRRIVMALELLPFPMLQHAAGAIGVGPIAQLLADAAHHLQRFVAGSGSVYSLGVGRFVVTLGDMSAHQAETYAHALLGEMRQPLVSDSLPMELHLRAGLIALKLEQDLAGDAVRKATVALNQATLDSRPLVWYEPDTDERHQRAHKLLRQIPRALAEGEFRLVYQPKLDVLTGRFDGVEALLRWTNPELGNVPPGEFIPLVERTALIHTVTEWVLHTALAQLSEWRAIGLDLAVAVNVSSRNLEELGFMRMLQNACAVYNVEPGYLHIECTENAILTGTATLATLQEVQQAGIQVSLDDFGSGYCNLMCLHDMPVGLLKIDQSLVKTIATDARALALLRSIVSLGHTMGYRLLAEGVETQEVFDALLDLKIDKIQGYFLSRPLPAQDVPAFLAQHQKS